MRVLLRFIHEQQRKPQKDEPACCMNKKCSEPGA